jgi:hypothetical protein
MHLTGQPAAIFMFPVDYIPRLLTWPWAWAPPSVRDAPTMREHPTKRRLAAFSSSPCVGGCVTEQCKPTKLMA